MFRSCLPPSRSCLTYELPWDQATRSAYIEKAAESRCVAGKHAYFARALLVRNTGQFSVGGYLYVRSRKYAHDDWKGAELDRLCCVTFLPWLFAVAAETHRKDGTKAPRLPARVLIPWSYKHARVFDSPILLAMCVVARAMYFEPLRSTATPPKHNPDVFARPFSGGRPIFATWSRNAFCRAWRVQRSPP